MKTILVVDDEARIREVVQYGLEKEGFAVRAAANGALALEAIERGGVDLVVLDVSMPELDGLEVCRRIRQKSKLPVLFLSSRAEEIDRIVGLELGGDDYLVKPFSPRELVARVRAVLRRTEVGAEPEAPRTRFVHGALTIDVERHEARVGEAIVAFTPTELGLLVALLERPGLVLTRGQLMQRAYRYDHRITERTIDTHVRRVRQKLKPFDLDPILTVHGVGYKSNEPG